MFEENSANLNGNKNYELSGSKKSFFKTGKFWVLILIILLAIGVVVRYSNKSQVKANSDEAVQKEVQSVVDAVSKIYNLPAGETPTLATVADATKLKDQAFFKDAQNGDKLLAYTRSMVAVLYRPATNRIITVAPIIIDQGQRASTTTVPNVK